MVEALYTRAEQVRGLATFGTAFSSHVVDGRLHGQLHAGGAVTGRYTSTDPNLQNIPTDPEFRGFFRAPEGRVLVDADYSQLELRVFAARSGDAKMIAAFEDGWDYHDLVSAASRLHPAAGQGDQLWNHLWHGCSDAGGGAGRR